MGELAVIVVVAGKDSLHVADFVDEGDGVVLTEDILVLPASRDGDCIPFIGINGD